MTSNSTFTEAINSNFAPLEFTVESTNGSDIVIWYTEIGSVPFKCQSSGNFTEQTTAPYAASVLDHEDFIPLMQFLKLHEDELALFCEKYKQEQHKCEFDSAEKLPADFDWSSVKPGDEAVLRSGLKRCIKSITISDDEERIFPITIEFTNNFSDSYTRIGFECDECPSHSDIISIIHNN